MRVRETHTYHSLVLSLGIIMALCTVPASAASTPSAKRELRPSFPCSAYHEAVERRQARRQREQRRNCEAEPSPACQDALRQRSEQLDRLILAIRNWREPTSAEVLLSVLRLLNPVASARVERPPAP